MRWRGFEINYLTELEPPIVRLSLGSIMNKMPTLASVEIDTLKRTFDCAVVALVAGQKHFTSNSYSLAVLGLDMNLSHPNKILQQNILSAVY